MILTRNPLLSLLIIAIALGGIVPISHAENTLNQTNASEPYYITIDPIGNHTIGDVFFINGTTNLPTSELLIMNIYNFNVFCCSQKSGHLKNDACSELSFDNVAEVSGFSIYPDLSGSNRFSINVTDRVMDFVGGDYVVYVCSNQTCSVGLAKNQEACSSPGPFVSTSKTDYFTLFPAVNATPTTAATGETANVTSSATETVTGTTVATLTVTPVSTVGISPYNDINYPSPQDPTEAWLANLSFPRTKINYEVLVFEDPDYPIYVHSGETRKTTMGCYYYDRAVPADQAAARFNITNTSGKPVGDQLYLSIRLYPNSSTHIVDPYVTQIKARDEEWHLVNAWVDVNNLDSLAALDGVRRVGFIVLTGTSGENTSVQTLGDSSQKTSRTTSSTPPPTTPGSGLEWGIPVGAVLVDSVLL
jgi:hypothetical protein